MKRRGRPPRPLTRRELWWIRRVWTLYTNQHMLHYLRGGRTRLYQLARALALPPRPKGPRPHA
jgi:hypothetical protein